MKVLIVGSNGFLGSWTKKILDNEKNHEILEIKNNKHIDILSYTTLSKYLTETKPDIVINCAAFVGGISYGYKFPAKILSENTQMGINLYKASLNAGIKKIINPISNCAYPKKLTTYKEEEFFSGPPDESVYEYATSKRMLVDLASSYMKQYEFSSVNVVLSNMYGPNDHFESERSHALGALIMKICNAKIDNKETVEIWGTGKPIREWLYVKDGAKALIKSIDLKEGNHFFNVGVNKGISILDLANIIKSKARWNGNFEFDLTRPDGVLEKKVDGSYGSEVLNWSPEVSLETGIEDTVEWYFKNYGTK